MPEIISNRKFPRLQADATMTQAAPVQNTWYTILDTTLDVRILAISCAVAVANEDLEVRMIIDGRTVSGTKANAVAGATQGWRLFGSMGSMTLLLYPNSSSLEQQASFLIDGHSVKIDVRKTSANGAGDLTGMVNYAKW